MCSTMCCQAIGGEDCTFVSQSRKYTHKIIKVVEGETFFFFFTTKLVGCIESVCNGSECVAHGFLKVRGPSPHICPEIITRTYAYHVPHYFVKSFVLSNSDERWQMSCLNISFRYTRYELRATHLWRRDGVTLRP